MGMKLNLETDTGSNATYVIIERLDVFPKTRYVDVRVFGFVSKSKRNEGKLPNYVKDNIRFTFEELQIPSDISDITQKDIYKALSKLEIFKDATEE